MTNFRPTTLFLLVLACGAPGVYAAQGDVTPAAKPLPPGSNMLVADVHAANHFGAEENAEKKPKAELKIIPVEGQPFPKAFQITCTEKVANFWGTQLMFDGNTSVKKDDVALLRFFMRGDSKSEDGEARVTVYFQRNAAPYDKAFSYEASAGKEWKEFAVPFKVHGNFEKGQTMLCFGLGGPVQNIEIGGVECLNFEKAAELKDLPHTRLTYIGREANAAWRLAAAERIEKYRKGNLKVVVQDAAGKPVENADVNVTMLKHSYGFGSAIGAFHVAEQAGMPLNPPYPKGITEAEYKSSNEKYVGMIKQLFNKIVTENDLKWGGWVGKPADRANKEKTLKALAWLKENGITARGHVLVWPSFKNSPPFLRGLRNDKEKLGAAILEHIKDEATATKDLVTEFDVMNEPFDNHDFMDLLGKDVMVEWFKTAREAFGPNVKTFINDYGILEAGGQTDTPHQKAYYDTIKYLVDKGAPFDGIGLQSHFGSNVTPPATCIKILDHFADFGKVLEVTEFDINTTDEELQADYTRDFMTVIFSHPSTNGFIMWGFWENAHWIPNGAMYRTDWTPKPNALVYQDLVFKQWWTNAAGKSGAEGGFATRAFFGEYEIKAVVNGKTITSKATFTPESMPVVLKTE